MNATNVVLWSGGFNSTYMLLKLLGNDNVQKPIHVVTFSGSLLGSAKATREKYARAKINNYIDQKQIITHKISISTNDEINLFTTEEIISCLTIIPQVIMGDDINIWMGFDLYDNMLGLKMKSILDFLKSYSNIIGRNLHLYTPHLTNGKENIIAELLILYEDIFKNCVTCDFMVGSFCGGCDSCLNLKKSLYHAHNIIHDSEYKKKIKRYAQLWFHEDISDIVTDQRYLCNCGLCNPDSGNATPKLMNPYKSIIKPKRNVTPSIQILSDDEAKDLLNNMKDDK